MTRFLYPVMASAATIALHYFTGLSWGWAALGCFVAWPLIGTLVTADDDLPGGWSNPDGDMRPPWLVASSWSPVCLGLAVALSLFSIEAGVGSRASLILGILAVAAGLVSALLWQRGDASAAAPKAIPPASDADGTK